jgi:hypothetical protein
VARSQHLPDRLDGTEFTTTTIERRRRRMGYDGRRSVWLSGGEGMDVYSPQVREIISRPNTTAEQRMLELFFSPTATSQAADKGMAGSHRCTKDR